MRSPCALQQANCCTPLCRKQFNRAGLDLGGACLFRVVFHYNPALLATARGCFMLDPSSSRIVMTFLLKSSTYVTISHVSHFTLAAITFSDDNELATGLMSGIRRAHFSQQPHCVPLHQLAVFLW
jgi:hypothetical protein